MSPRVVVPRNRVEERRQASIIGARIRQLRLARGLTQGQVAGERFSKAYISALETGIAFPSMPSLQFIAGQLRVSPDWFLAQHHSGDADGRVYVELDDGRALGMPIARSRKLMAARVDQLEDWAVTEYGLAIAWPAIGEEIGIEDFLGMRMLAPSEVEASFPVDDAGLSAEVQMPAPARAPRRRASRRSRYAPWPTGLARSTGGRSARPCGRSRRCSAESCRPPRGGTRAWYSAVNPLAKAIKVAGWHASVGLKGERVTLRRRVGRRPAVR